MLKLQNVSFRGEQLSDVLIASVRGMRPNENIIIFRETRVYREFSVLIDAENHCLGASYARFSFCMYFFRILIRKSRKICEGPPREIVQGGTS